MPQPAISRQRHSVFRLSVSKWSYNCEHDILKNCLWEFRQIYNFGVVGDKDELVIDLKVKRSKVKVQPEHKWSNVTIAL